MILRQHGAAVQAFGSSAELSGGARAQPAGRARPGVLLVDIAMPGEDGFAALRRVRSVEMARGAERADPGHRAHRLHPDRARAPDGGGLRRPRRQAARRRQAGGGDPARRRGRPARRDARRLAR